MPSATHFSRTTRRAVMESWSAVPRIAATMLTWLTLIDEKTTVMNVSDTPRQ